MADDDDDIVYIYITSSEAGIGQISMQTKTAPLKELGNPDPTRYAYLNKNWEQFESDRGFFGLYGWTANEHLTGLGFIEKDTACV